MNFSYERAATILAEAELFGEKQVAQRWGISVRTIKNYRKRMESDKQLSAFFLEKKELLTVDWSKDATDCLRTGLRTLTNLIKNEDSESKKNSCCH